jgi:hypothetical protein
VLDLSFLAQSSGDPPTPPKKLVEFRMKVDPSKLR